MKTQKDIQKQYSDWSDFKDFLVLKIKEAKIEREKAEEKVTLKEVEATVKGKELILDNMCH